MFDLTKRDKSDDCNNGYYSRTPFPFDFCRSALIKRGGTGFKVFKSGRSEQVSRPGIRFRGLSGLDVSSHTQLQSAQVTRMKSAGVITPRSRRRPGMDSFSIISHNGQAKASVDRSYIAPRKGVSGNRVNDFQSLVKDFDFRFMHQCMESSNSESGPSDSKCNLFGSTGGYRLKYHTNKYKTQEEKSSTAGATSEKFNIGTDLFFTFHKRRFSQVGRVCLV